MASKLKLLPRVIVKYILAKEGKQTTQDILKNHLTTFPELRNASYLKREGLNVVWKEGGIFKKANHFVINPVTKGPTFFWEIDPNIKSAYEDLTPERVRLLEGYPEDNQEPKEAVPLLGRTGPYAGFKKYCPKGHLRTQKV
ncbi:hypothetical protein DSO57_1008416 [Entomophthora muscae]|uniref:Uncharacterized protein n=1 Tax=Entomophthora muscae TaxID=34485 RepID=A0ACC2SJX5_9FUNG|nr:hypothetical protein DSO57_1008416 [Entomophthora muscae]